MNKILGVCVMSLSLLISACGQSSFTTAVNNHTTIENTAYRAYDGETILRGMLTGKGPAAGHFDEVWKHPDVLDALSKTTEEERARVDQQFEAIVSGIKQNDPDFLSDFQAQMQSGDPSKVYGAIIDVNKKIEGLRATQPEKIGPQACTPATFCLVVWHTAAAVTHYVAVVVVLYVKLALPDSSVPGTMTAQTIASEQFMARLAKSLSVVR